MNREPFVFNDIILKVVPTGAYNHEVNLILSDERSNWDHNIFNDEHSGLEIAIARLNMDINDSNKEISNYKNQVDKQREKIETLEKSQKKPKDYVKILNSCGENIANLIESIRDTESYIVEKTKELKDLEHKHLVSLNQTRSLGSVKANYKKHKNLDYLKKEVHYHCALADEYRYGPKYVAPYRGHLLNYETAPFERRTVDVLNFRAKDYEYELTY